MSRVVSINGVYFDVADIRLFSYISQTKLVVRLKTEHTLTLEFDDTDHAYAVAEELADAWDTCLTSQNTTLKD